MTEMFAGKHALVTGGGSGVGEAIALMLAAQGAVVTITGRRPEPLQATADKHANIFPVVVDVTDLSAMIIQVTTVVEERGAVDFAIANAGTANSVPFVRMSADDWSSSLSTNLTGVFNTYQSVLPHMEKKGTGRLIAIASTAALKGYEYVSAYCAAKHGVIGLTRSLALELATKGITVNAVCPGFTETPMLQRSVDNIATKTGMSSESARKALSKSNPQGQFIQPDEIANTVSWLCNDLSGSITGQAISVSGGEV